MMVYQARCGRCGFENRRLLLEETHGLFECERCGTVNHLRSFHNGKKPDEMSRTGKRTPDPRKEGERLAQT